ncbi:hypothetical protein HQ587_09305 [bacterium]|nr:hypothetical protein [bacterium]
MKLLHAISKYLTDNIPSIHAFKDDIAFVAAGNPYPYFLVDLISTRKRNLGTGVWDATLEDNGDTATQVKVTKHHQVLRFTIRAVNSSEKNGNVIVTEVCDHIDELLADLCREGSVDLVDPVSSESVHIEQVIFQGRSDLAPIEKGMPFVYQQSLSYLFVEHHHRTRVVENRMETIKIEI